MKKKTTNPYIDKRDFRAVLFSDSSLSNVKQVVELFGGKILLNAAQSGSIQGCRAQYVSKNCFLRTADPIKRNELRIRKGTDSFRYDVYVFSYTPNEKGRSPVFLAAIPFASMAREFFGKIHASKPSTNFAYLRPETEALVPKLLTRFKGSERIKTVGINWSVTGDTGRSDQIVLRGSDVIYSEMFQYLQKTGSEAGSGLSLTSRKFQLRYEMPQGHDNLKLSFDKFGNYSIWVTSEGSNLADVFDIFEVLYRAKLITREERFPVRNSIEEPIFP